MSKPYFFNSQQLRHDINRDAADSSFLPEPDARSRASAQRHRVQHELATSAGSREREDARPNSGPTSIWTAPAFRIRL